MKKGSFRLAFPVQFHHNYDTTVLGLQKVTIGNGMGMTAT